MTQSNLLVPQQRLKEMAKEEPRLYELHHERLVFASSVTSVDIGEGGADEPRHRAAVLTAVTSRRNNAPHLFMVGDTSHPDVAKELREAGALVVMVRPDEVGLARPYLTAAQLIDRYAGSETLMVKAEGDKNLASAQNIGALLDASDQGYNVITGVRSTDTWASMPEYQVVTEAPLALFIAQIARVPYDTPSGVLALDWRGRRLLYQTNCNDWGYLIQVPWDSKKTGASVTEAEVDFRYPPAMVASEQTPKQDAKRRQQLLLMLDRAVSVAGGLERLDGSQRRTQQTCLRLLNGLERLANRGN